MAYKRNRYGSIIFTDDKGKEFTITKKEQQEIKTYVKRANQRRLDKAKRYYEGIKDNINMRGISNESYLDLMTSKGFITEKYKTDLKQFKNKDEVKDFIKELKTVTKRGYGEDRVEDIRKSMIKRTKQNYGISQTRTLIERLKGLTRAELLSIYLHNDEIVKTLYGSGKTDNIEELISKTESDINFYLLTNQQLREKSKRS